MAIPILAIIFGFVLFVVKLAMDHERAKLSIKAGSDNSMTTSELKAMIEQAVQDAVAPLEKRIEELSGDSGDSVTDSDESVKELPAAEARLDLDELDDFAEEKPAAVQSRQRTR